MADVATRLRTYLLADANIAAKVGTRVHQDHVPEAPLSPYIYFGRTSAVAEMTLGETGITPFRHNFAVECWADRLSEAQALADLVWTRCNGTATGATFGDSTVKGIFVESQDDDYEPEGVPSDRGLHVAALALEVIPT